jgi:ATP-dependent Clp protease ATP-binding subunit ClpX
MGFRQRKLGGSEQANARPDGDLLKYVEPEDLVRYGLIPELVGRLPVVASLDELSEQALVDILHKPKYALVKQYQYFFAEDGVNLKFTPGALEEVARIAHARKTGARALRSIVEKLLLDLMFSIPSTRPGGEITIDAPDVHELLAGKLLHLPLPGEPRIELSRGPDEEPQSGTGTTG